MLFGLPLGGFRLAKLATRRPKTARRRPKMAPRCAQDAPRLIQDAPARGQDDPRWAKMAHDGFKMVQDGSIPRKMAQDGPSMTSRWPPVRRWIGMCVVLPPAARRQMHRDVDRFAARRPPADEN